MPTESPLDPWTLATFEGAEKLRLIEDAKLTFAEKLAWLEEIEELGLRLQAARNKGRSPKLQ